MNRRVWVFTVVVMVLFYGGVMHVALKDRPQGAPEARLPDTGGPLSTEVQADLLDAETEARLRSLAGGSPDPCLTLRVMTRRLEKDDKDAEALRHRARAHFLISQWKDAAADFDRLIPLTNSGADRSWIALEAAYSHQLAENLTMAQERYDLAFALGKEHGCITGEYYYRRGQFRGRIDDADGAIKDFETAGKSADLRRAYMAYENLANWAYERRMKEKGDAYSRLADEKRALYDKTKKR